ncbi:MAG: metal ABC transporter permease [Candidatus Aminicenantaceae bacterium]
MESFLNYGFVQKALVSGVLIAIACAILGVFLILRRDAMFAHGLAHVTFAGVALGLFLGIMPLVAALCVAILAALAILKLKEKAGLYGDTAIGVLSSVGMALGILIVSLAQNFNVDLFSYLFGEILAIETSEVWLSVGLVICVLLVVLINYHKFLYIAFDSESAKASGIRVNRLDILLAVLTAVTVVLGMKVVGLLLVAALVVIPAAAALQVATSFKVALIVSCFVALLSVVLGLFLAFYFDFPASGTIVLLAFFLFGLFFVFKRVKSLI